MNKRREEKREREGKVRKDERGEVRREEKRKIGREEKGEGELKAELERKKRRCRYCHSK